MPRGTASATKWAFVLASAAPKKEGKVYDVFSARLDQGANFAFNNHINYPFRNIGGGNLSSSEL